MTREEFKTIVKAFRAAYSNCPITTQEIFDLWYQMLADLDYRLVSRNLEKHIKTNRFPPTVAELRGTTGGSKDLNNFQRRVYDMDSMETALLETSRQEMESKKIEGGGGYALDGSNTGQV